MDGDGKMTYKLVWMWDICVEAHICGPNISLLLNKISSNGAQYVALKKKIG
jgi:hypothetical protein